jgi:hypothetical protein
VQAVSVYVDYFMLVKINRPHLVCLIIIGLLRHLQYKSLEHLLRLGFLSEKNLKSFSKVIYFYLSSF